jgi:segregation and condensation protein A
MIEPVHPEQLPPSRPGSSGESQVEVSKGSEEGSLEEESSGYTVHLERVYHGPLDLLLKLVRDKELEIHVVSLAEVCDGYCLYIRELPDIQIDEAADYLVIAATLLAIKSKSLLPTEEVESEDDLFDPGEELVQQLLAYKELRKASDQLGERWYARQRLLGAGGKWLGKFQPVEDEEEQEVDLGEVSIWDLLKLITKLEAETGFMRPHEIRQMGRPLRAYVQEVWEKLQSISETSLLTLLREGNHGRSDAAFYFVALLELAKQQQINLKQRDFFDDIHVVRSETKELFNLDAIDEQFDVEAAPSEPEVDELFEQDLPQSDLPIHHP